MTTTAARTNSANPGSTGGAGGTGSGEGTANKEPSSTEGARNPWPTFVVCAVASYITTLDLSVVNVAFTDIAKSFPTVTRGQLSWVVTGYAITFGAFLVFAGQTADRIGRKRVFLLGVSMFLVGSAICAASQTLGLLIAGRIVQGTGGALLLPSSTGLLLAAFGVEKRTQVIAWVGGIGALGVASGPTIGAFMVDWLGWRSAFWINLPVCLLALVLGVKVVRESDRQEGPNPDAIGAAMLVLGVGSLVLGISEGESWGWSSGRVLGLFLLSAALLVGVVVKSRSHPAPALPIELFSEKMFSIANAGSFVFGAGFSGMALNNVLFLRSIWHFSVVRAGWFSVLSPLTVAAVASVLAGRLMKRFGFQTMMFAGPILFATSQVLLALLLNPKPKPWTIWLPLGVLQGASIGMTFPVLGAAAVVRLPPMRFAVGSAVNNTFRQVGAAVGVALVVVIQTSSEGITGFRNGWWFSAACAAMVAVFAFGMPK